MYNTDGRDLFEVYLDTDGRGSFSDLNLHRIKSIHACVRVSL